MLNSKKVRMRQVLVLSLSLLLISGCGVNWKVNIQILRLQSKNTSLRRHAAGVLGGIGPEARAAVPVLIQALKDRDDWSIRREAAEALGGIVRLGALARLSCTLLGDSLSQRDTIDVG